MQGKSSYNTFTLKVFALMMEAISTTETYKRLYDATSQKTGIFFGAGTVESINVI
jgi:hypothetical protein